MGGLALFETRVTRLPSSVNAAPPVPWTSAGATVFTAQGVSLLGALGNDQMFRIHPGAIGPALLALPLLRSDFLASPFPLGFPAVLPAEAWGWDCGSPGPAVVYASRTLESCYLIPFSRFSRYCNKGSALGLLAL